MTVEARPKRSVGGAFIQLLLALILVALIVLYFRNEDFLIDKISFLSKIKNILWVWVGFGVVGFIAAVLWLNGHRALAAAKGYAPLTGLVLGFVLVLGLLILIALPSRAKAAAPSEPAPAEGGEQS